MPSNLTDASAFTSPIVVPADGDARNAASVATGFQGLANRTKLLRDLIGDGYLRGASTIDSDGVTINISPIAALSLGGVVLVAASGLVVTAVGHGASAWHYIYAFNSGGSLAAEVSTTAPDSARVFKTADTTRRYLGCFRTRADGSARPFRCHQGVYRWRFSAFSGTGADSMALDAGTSASFADVSCTAWMPPHARLADIAIYTNVSGGTAGHIVEMRTKGDTTATVYAYAPHATPGTIGGLQIETNASQVFEYKATPSGGGTLNVSIRVQGFVGA